MSGPVFLLPHVPECAGTSVGRHLADHPGAAFWSPPRRARSMPIEIFGRKWDHRLPAPAGAIRAVRRVDWRPLRLSDLPAATRAGLDRRPVLDRYLWRRWRWGDSRARPGVTASHLRPELRRPAAELRRRIRRARR